MTWLHLVAYFFGGLFLINAVPHLVSGVMGQSFQSPFAKPPGVGLSSSSVNVLWGVFNLLVAYALIAHVGSFDFRSATDAAAAGLGMLFGGLLLAHLFGRFHGGGTTPRF